MVFIFQKMRFFQNCSKIDFKEKSKEVLFSDLVHHVTSKLKFVEKQLYKKQYAPK